MLADETSRCWGPSCHTSAKALVVSCILCMLIFNPGSCRLSANTHCPPVVAVSMLHIDDQHCMFMYLTAMPGIHADRTDMHPV